MRHVELTLQPGTRVLVAVLDVLRDKTFVASALDSLKVVDPPLRIDHGQWLVPAGAVVRPQGAAQKADACDADGLVFQQMNTGAHGFCACPLQRTVNAGAVVPVVMVAEHEHHGLIGERLLGPCDGLATGVDVACQDHHIGLSVDRAEGSDLVVQV